MKISKKSFLISPNYFYNRPKIFHHSGIIKLIESLTDDEVISVLKYGTHIPDNLKRCLVLNSSTYIDYVPLSWVVDFWDTFSIDEMKQCIRKYR